MALRYMPVSGYTWNFLISPYQYVYGISLCVFIRLFMALRYKPVSGCLWQFTISLYQDVYDTLLYPCINEAAL